MLSMNPIHPLFGIEVEGVDLTRPLDDAAFAEIRDAFEQHSVLVFRGQNLTDEQQVAFSRRFGPLEVTRKGAVGAGSETIVLSNVGPAGEVVPPDHKQALNDRANRLWHTDSSFKPVPALASLLSGREVPPEGGETEYASTRAAYAALPDDIRARIEGLVAEHHFAHSRAQVDPNALSEEEKARFPPVRRPLVWAHPATGERALYLGSHAARVVGMAEAEGRALLDELLAFATQARFVYRHAWRPYDLVVWDNRCTLHRGRPFDGTRYRRVMVRTTVADDEPPLAA